MSDALRGLPASPGWAAAPALRLGGGLIELPPLPPADDPDAEAADAADALAAVAADLRERAAAAMPVARDVLQALAALVADPALDAEIRRRTAEREPAAAAAWHAFDGFADQLRALGGAFAERADDLVDLRARVAARLLGLPEPRMPSAGEARVLVAAALSPADAAALDGASVVAIVTATGGPTSHTAIVARSLGIPAVVGCAGVMEAVDDRTLVAVDGDSGEVLLEPDDELVRRRGEDAERAAAAARAVTGPGRTADGHAIALLVNAAGPADVATLDDGCAGVGLLRTELLFLGRDVAPTVEEQATAYREILRKLEGRTATVRTLDAGSDKPLAFANDADEENPALGVRGLRVDRINPRLLDDQLEAIAQAADGLEVELKVMAPMVSTVPEARAFVARARQHGIEHAGVMVEVPALALCARRLVDEVDFISIGSNDLAQYTLAACRTLGALGDLLDPWQPGLLRLIGETLGIAREHGVPASVCGEAASDPELACVLVGFGADGLSTSPAMLPRVRAALAARTFEQCRAAASAALDHEPSLSAISR